MPWGKKRTATAWQEARATSVNTYPNRESGETPGWKHSHRDQQSGKARDTSARHSPWQEPCGSRGELPEHRACDLPNDSAHLALSRNDIPSLVRVVVNTLIPALTSNESTTIEPQGGRPEKTSSMAAATLSPTTREPTLLAQAATNLPSLRNEPANPPPVSCMYTNVLFVVVYHK